MTENFNSEIYRKNLADSLKEIRNSGEGGREKARFFLDTAKETSLYQTADAEHKAEAAAFRETVEKAKRAEGEGEQEEEPSAGEPQPAAELLETNESRIEALVQELLTLIATNPNYRFGVSANGSLYGGGASLGQVGYVLDQKTGSFVARGNDYDPGSDPTLYDGDGDITTPYTPFLKAEMVSGREIVKYRGWMNWENTSANSFTIDRRGPVTFSGALFIKNTQEAADAVSDKLHEALNAAASPESKSVMWKFFVDAFRKYTPDYWNYVEKQWQERPQNAGKDIRNCLD